MVGFEARHPERNLFQTGASAALRPTSCRRMNHKEQELLTVEHEGKPILTKWCPADLRIAAELVEKHHVDAETGQRAAQSILSGCRYGRYDNLSANDAASVVTSDMRRASGDHHLYLEAVDPTRPTIDWVAEWRSNGSAEQWGIPDVEVLTPDIGYLKITSFYPLPDAEPSIANAFEVLRNTASLIVDLRSNGGGDSDTADAIFATLAPGEPTRPFAVVGRGSRTSPAPPPRRSWPEYGGSRPVAVLIDKRTFSAPEAIAFALQERQLAVVVGERSAGGANMMSDPIPIAGRFRLGVPTERPASVLTGANWEGGGVTPNITAGRHQAKALAFEVLRRQRDEGRRCSGSSSGQSPESSCHEM